MGHDGGSSNWICRAHEQCPMDWRDIKRDEEIVMGEVWTTRGFQLASVQPVESGVVLGNAIHEESGKNMTCITMWGLLMKDL